VESSTPAEQLAQISKTSVIDQWGQGHPVFGDLSRFVAIHTNELRDFNVKMYNQHDGLDTLRREILAKRVFVVVDFPAPPKHRHSGTR
jgi:hypothetical protein